MNWPPQKQHWVQRRKQGIAALGSPGTSQIHAFLAGVYLPPAENTRPDDGDNENDAGDGGTQRQPPTSA